jgi:hypothetical protein
MTGETEGQETEETEAEMSDAVDDSLSNTLAVDDDSMDDIEEDIERIRNHSAARTVFRQRRSDIDTV